MDSTEQAPQSALRTGSTQDYPIPAQAAAGQRAPAHAQAESQKVLATPARAHGEDKRTGGQKASDLRQRRIDFIVDLMGKGLWHTGKTGPVLAKRWGVREDYVRELAGIASHVVRGDVCDRTVVQSRLGVALMASLNDAQRRGQHNMVANLADKYMRLVGLGHPDVAPPMVQGATTNNTQVVVQVVQPTDVPKEVVKGSVFARMIKKKPEAPPSDGEPEDPA